MGNLQEQLAARWTIDPTGAALPYVVVVRLGTSKELSGLTWRLGILDFSLQYRWMCDFCGTGAIKTPDCPICGASDPLRDLGYPFVFEPYDRKKHGRSENLKTVINRPNLKVVLYE